MQSDMAGVVDVHHNGILHPQPEYAHKRKREETDQHAMLPKLPSCPAFMIPHSGFTPTGTLVGSADKPVKSDDVELSAI